MGFFNTTLLANSFVFFTSTSTSIAISTEILIAVLLISIVSILKLKKTTNNLRLPPGPAPWPIIGNVPEMLRNRPTSRWIHNVMKEMSTEICLIRFANTNVIPVTCPDIAREILKKNDAIFASRPLSMSAHAISGGYLTTAMVPYGEQWKKMRKMLMSEIVSPARHNWLHDKRAEEADNLVFYVHNQCKSNNIVNVRTVTQHYCGNVIRKLLFNRRYFGNTIPDGGPGVKETEHVAAIFTALKYVFSFCISDYMPYLLGLDLDGQEKIVKDAHRTIRKYQNPIVDERILQWQSGERKEMEDLLDVMITLKDSNGKPLLTPEEIKSQAVEFALATIDNPSHAVEWALAEMINQPELIRKATEEIDRVVGKDRLVQESDISSLNYVKACAKEAFRLHPLAPFNVPHVSMQDITIDGYFIPKGSHVLISRYGLGRNPKTWKDPLKFNPKRHMNVDTVVLTDHNLNLLTFSTRRRGCVGVLLGTSLTVMLLARLLQCFDWSPPGQATSIDLSEAENDLTLARPLTAFAKPRLSPHLYPISS